MKAAVQVEALKLARSRVGVVATAVIAGGLLALVAGVMAAVGTGDRALIAKLGGQVVAGWPGLIDVAAQITSAGGLLGFGVVLAWLFSREFADGTITGLFALPVGRGRLAAAKLAVFCGWAAAVSLVVVALLLAVGLVGGYGAPGPHDWAGLARQFALGLLSAAVALPVAWVAAAARSLLAGVAAAVGLVVVAQVGALAGAGGWMPFAAPALWALSGGTAVSPVQLSVPVALAALVSGAVVASWRRLQLDR